MEREYDRLNKHITEELQDSLEFLRLMCDTMPPVKLPLTPPTLDPVIIFTDAEGKQRDGATPPSGHLGFVVYHPVYGKRYAHAPAPREWAELFDRIKQRKTYIGQYELAAAITPFLSLPTEWFRDRPVELWIDNSGAIGGLIGGYSGKPDCARLINLFHFAVAKLGIRSLWIDYVASESNPADIPSRLHEMSREEAKAEVADLGDLMAMTLPRFAKKDGTWRSYTEIARSVWNSR